MFHKYSRASSRQTTKSRVNIHRPVPALVLLCPKPSLKSIWYDNCRQYTRQRKYIYRPIPRNADVFQADKNIQLSNQQQESSIVPGSLDVLPETDTYLTESVHTENAEEKDPHRIIGRRQ